MSLQDWDAFGRDVPTLLDLKPSGRFLMEDFYYAGGLPAIIRALGEKGLLHHKDAPTVNGKSIWENCQNAPTYNAEVIRPFDKPLVESGGIAVLTGNLAPDGAVLKPSAASPHLLKHRGRAVVFESIEDYHARIADPNLDVDASCVLVLKNCGTEGLSRHGRGGEHGAAAESARDRRDRHGAHLRCAHEWTAYGTVVLHVCPEAAIGGPLALVKNGDMIELDVPGRR